MPAESSLHLSFDWDTHFVWSRDGTKCLGACSLMAARYWGVQLSDSECGRILAELAVPAFRGPDAAQIVKAVEQVVGTSTEPSPTSLETKLEDFLESGTITTPSTQISLRQDFFHARGIESLKPAFQVAKPIPQIVIYDDLMASYNVESPGGHASLVERLDFDAGFIYLIDPNAEKRKSPIYYTFDDFRRGWKSFEQATIILYPAGFYRTTRSITSSLALGDDVE